MSTETGIAALASANMITAMSGQLIASAAQQVSEIQQQGGGDLLASAKITSNADGSESIDVKA